MPPVLASPYICAAVKQVLTVILIFVMGFQAIFPLALTSYYNINQSYFASVLCINQDKPELQCKGKCFLKKQLDKSEKENSKEKANLKSVDHVIYPFTALLSTQQLHYAIATQYPPFQPDPYQFLLLKNCFRPPVA